MDVILLEQTDVPIEGKYAVSATDSPEFDHVVIGGGSAASPIIRRLLDAGRRVAVIEAGGRDDHPDLRVPDRMIALRGTPHDFGYATVPQRELGGRTVSWPRGRVLGGSSAINGMVHARGHRADYDSWAYGGADGWSYADVLPYFRKLENVSEDLQSPYRGSAGLLPARTVTNPHPVNTAQLAAAIQAGIPFNPDQNGEDIYGVGYTQLNIVEGRRVSAWEAYVAPVLPHANLTLYTDALASRVVTRNRRAVAVEFIRAGQTHTVRSQADVVISAGALNSPQLLQLSGLGPAASLRALGIPVVVDLPGVGENLHDHILAEVVWRSRRPVDPTGYAPLEVQFFADSRSGLVSPDLQPVTGTGAYPIPGYDLPFGQVFSWFAGVVRPRSRGRLWLTSVDPTVPALFDPGYLTDPADLDALVAAVELVREIGRQPALEEWNAGELAPGPSVTTRDALKDFLRLSMDTYYHPVGTAKIGVDRLSVVDARLRVHGTENLRVADASVFPEIPAANTHVPAVMVGERAADFILADS